MAEQYLEVWYVQVDGVEDKKRKVLGRTVFQSPLKDPESMAFQTDNLIKKSYSNDHVASSFLSEPKELPSFGEIRKGQIALAYLRLNTLKDGVKIHPANVPSELGVRVKEFAALYPNLNVTFDEVLGIHEELTELVTKATYKRLRNKVGATD